MDTTNGFTVDLSAMNFNNSTTSTISIVPTAHAERIVRVNRRVESLIKPGQSYEIVDNDGDRIGTIGGKFERLDIDNDLTPIQENYSEVLDCETTEQVDDYMFMVDVMAAVINLIDYPSEERSPWSGKTILEAQLEWINEQRANEDEARENASEIEAEQEAESQLCNGMLNRSTGDIYHSPGSYCPIHFSN